MCIRDRCQGGSCGAQEALRIRDVINVLPARKPPDTKDVARCGYDTRDHQSRCCRASQDSCRVLRRRCRRAAGRTAEGRGTGREVRTAEQHANQVSACQRSTRAHLVTTPRASTPSSGNRPPDTSTPSKILASCPCPHQDAPFCFVAQKRSSG